MRLRLGMAILLATTPAAFAQGFEIVVPDRPDVPIVINGIDVNYAVLEGAFGLGKGVNNQPTVYGGRLAPPEPNVGHYYPTLGLRPASGRLEIEPPANRKLPQPAESYHRSWQSQSMQLPATSPNAPPEVPLYPPPVIMAPRDGDDIRRNDLSGPTQDFGRTPERLPK
jgi:hypothetical protein